MIALRRARPALTRGLYRPLSGEGQVLAYVREANGTCMLVALNIGEEEASTFLRRPGSIALSTRLDREVEACDERVVLRPNDGVVIHLQEACSSSAGETSWDPG